MSVWLCTINLEVQNTLFSEKRKYHIEHLSGLNCNIHGLQGSSLSSYEELASMLYSSCQIKEG